MTVSFHERLRNFLLTGGGEDVLSRIFLQMIFGRNRLSLELRETLKELYGSLTTEVLSNEVIPDLFGILWMKREWILSRDDVNISYCMTILKNAFWDEVRKRNRMDRFSGEMPMVGEGEDAKEKEFRDETAGDEAAFVRQLAAEDLVHVWVKELSDAELRVFCDYLSRTHGERGRGEFVGDISEDARYQQLSRLKKRLRRLNEQSPDYRMFRDREIWNLAFSLLQSEICPGLRLFGENEWGRTDNDKA